MSLLHANVKAIDAESLIVHVKNSIQMATNGKSKLTSNILGIEGMSSSKVRHFLNNLCALPEAFYFEVGVWRGSTFVSALYQNTATLYGAIAIDNWAQFGGPKGDFLANTSKYLAKNSFRFYEQDVFSVDVKDIFNLPVTIYFYDGDHTAEAQRSAFTYFNTIFADTFIAVVDDWNHEPTRIGTKQAFAELGYTILFEQILPANYNGDLANWWNGLYVAVIQK